VPAQRDCVSNASGASVKEASETIEVWVSGARLREANEGRERSEFERIEPSVHEGASRNSARISKIMGPEVDEGRRN
jgi:hypothetical protein